MTPGFSVVIPMYRSTLTIANALASVATQTVAPLEVIAVDDCSPDETVQTAERCRQLFSQRDIPFLVVRQASNAGPSAARNVGIDRSRASHVAFLDSDDVWHPHKLQVMRSHLQHGAPPAMLYHSYTECASFNPHDDVRADGYRVTRMRLRDLLVRNSAQTSCVVLRRDGLERFDERARYCEDYDLWLRVVETGDVLRLVGPALTRLGRPQLAQGGLSGNTGRMRAGEMAAYYRFCSRKWLPRVALLPGLIGYSMLKHGLSRWRVSTGASGERSR